MSAFHSGLCVYLLPWSPLRGARTMYISPMCISCITFYFHCPPVMGLWTWNILGLLKSRALWGSLWYAICSMLPNAVKSANVRKSSWSKLCFQSLFVCYIISCHVCNALFYIQIELKAFCGIFMKTNAVLPAKSLFRFVETLVFNKNICIVWGLKLILNRLNSSWPSATYMRRDFQCLFPQRPRYMALISVLISPVPHTWGVTNGSLLASPPNSRHPPASLISPAPHICGASRTPVLTHVVWKILNVVTNVLVVLPDYRLP